VAHGHKHPPRAPRDPCGWLTFRDDTVLPFRVTRLRRSRSADGHCSSCRAQLVARTHFSHHAELCLTARRCRGATVRGAAPPRRGAAANRAAWRCRPGRRAVRHDGRCGRAHTGSSKSGHPKAEDRVITKGQPPAGVAWGARSVFVSVRHTRPRRGASFVRHRACPRRRSDPSCRTRTRESPLRHTPSRIQTGLSRSAPFVAGHSGRAGVLRGAPGANGNRSARARRETG